MMTTTCEERSLVGEATRNAVDHHLDGECGSLMEAIEAHSQGLGALLPKTYPMFILEEPELKPERASGVVDEMMDIITYAEEHLRWRGERLQKDDPYKGLIAMEAAEALRSFIDGDHSNLRETVGQRAEYAFGVLEKVPSIAPIEVKDSEAVLLAIKEWVGKGLREVSPEAGRPEASLMWNGSLRVPEEVMRARADDRSSSGTA